MNKNIYIYLLTHQMNAQHSIVRVPVRSQFVVVLAVV